MSLRSRSDAFSISVHSTADVDRRRKKLRMCRCVYAWSGTTWNFAALRGVERIANRWLERGSLELHAHLAGRRVLELAREERCRRRRRADDADADASSRTHTSHITNPKKMQQCEASAANGYSMQCDAFCHNPAHSIVAERCMPASRRPSGT